MAFLDDITGAEAYNWDEAGIYQLEETDPVQGGLEGISNRPLRELAIRTRNLHLKKADKTDDRFMTSDERNKLGGIEFNANKYVHPASHSASMINETLERLFMTPEERAKLSGIEENATADLTAAEIKALLETLTEESRLDASAIKNLPTGGEGGTGEDGREVELSTSGNYVVWRYVGETVWRNLVSLYSLQGPQGPAGADGTSVRIVGTVATSANLPSSAGDGDGYITQNDGHLHVWSSAQWQWIDVGNIRGPQGEKGDKGDTGSAGANGTNGADGADGLPPAHEWSGTSLRFQMPNGSWGGYVNLRPDAPRINVSVLSAHVPNVGASDTYGIAAYITVTERMTSCDISQSLGANISAHLRLFDGTSGAATNPVVTILETGTTYALWVQQWQLTVGHAVPQVYGTSTIGAIYSMAFRVNTSIYNV